MKKHKKINVTPKKRRHKKFKKKRRKKETIEITFTNYPLRINPLPLTIYTFGAVHKLMA